VRLLCAVINSDVRAENEVAVNVQAGKMRKSSEGSSAFLRFERIRLANS
jgi:hypothetical protein